MEIKKILKYIKIYFKLFRFGIIMETAYRFSFLTELLVEFGYQVAYILFFIGVFMNTKSIGGWNFYEVMFLAGLVIVISEIILGGIFIFNLTRLPEKIKNGDIDGVLLKPISSLFYLSLGMPYFASFISMSTGFYVMWFSVVHGHLNIHILNFLVFVLMTIFGLVIAYCLMVMVSTFSFKFLNAVMIPEISKQLVEYFMERPHTIYQGLLKIILFWIWPVVFVASIPTDMFLHKIEIKYIVTSLFFVVFLLFLTVKIWNKMIKLYSSASS